MLNIISQYDILMQLLAANDVLHSRDRAAGNEKSNESDRVNVTEGFEEIKVKKAIKDQRKEREHE